ncbi:PD-(D/E)XK nuclease family protein [Marinilabilia salmonicolor]|uniref:PD-(D/E)XK nuclease superfamily protein n=1 Tax=Marinilabilia salmonicolor TaxID=989 RepID=A0A368VCQ8_9BACT|nr:PD-(D/E)XK nuclease family protein [Marinilabilia salmonicolor]RCW36761.1 PD-(D/E)XK nuclease superfamily protein [Marinilabilia salmonicolor]
MIIHFSPAFAEGIYPLPEESNLKPDERFVGEAGLLMLLEREMGLSAEYSGNEERALLYKKALETYLESDGEAFYRNSFIQDELAVSEKILSWRDELVMAGMMNLSDDVELPPRLHTMHCVEKLYRQNGVLGYGMADRWQALSDLLPEAELSVEKIILHDKASLLHPFFGTLLEQLSNKTVVEEQLFEMEPEGSSNLNRLQKALLNGGEKLTLNALEEDDSLIFLKVKDNYVAGDFMADQIKGGYKPLFLNDDNVVFDNCLIASGLNASGSVNYSSTPQILQLFKLVSTGLFSPVNVKNLLSLLQAPYLPFSGFLARRLSNCLVEQPGINNRKWREIITEYTDVEDPDEAKKRKTALETFLSFHENETNTVSNIRNRYRALKQWVDQYPHLDVNEVKEEEKEQFYYLEGLCANLLSELDSLPDDEEVSEIRFSRMMEAMYKPGAFQYFRKQKDSPLVLRHPGAVTSQTTSVCWLNWQGGRQTGHPLSFLNKREWESLTQNGCGLYSFGSLVHLRYRHQLMGVLAASRQLVLVVPEVVSGEVSAPHALAGDFDAIIENPGDVTLDHDQMESWHQYFTGTSRQMPGEPVALPKPAAYLEGIEALQANYLRQHESPSSLEELIQNPFDWVANYPAHISGMGTVALPDLFRQKGLVTHAAVEEIMKTMKDHPEAVFEEAKISQILQEKIDEGALEFRLPENRFELHEMEGQFLASVQVLLDIIRENNLRVVDAEIFKDADIDSIGNVKGFLDLLLSDEHGNPVVFDLKWTFKSKKYASKIEEERDLQLILYREMMRQETGKEVKTGYFLLNDGKLYTRYDFTGMGVVKINAQSEEEEMLNRIVQSVQYRRGEFARGVVEAGEESSLNALAYHNDSEDKFLVPLESDGKNNKRTNYYSNLALFKGKIY